MKSTLLIITIGDFIGSSISIALAHSSGIHRRPPLRFPRVLRVLRAFLERLERLDPRLRLRLPPSPKNPRPNSPDLAPVGFFSEPS